MLYVQRLLEIKLEESLIKSVKFLKLTRSAAAGIRGKSDWNNETE